MGSERGKHVVVDPRRRQRPEAEMRTEAQARADRAGAGYRLYRHVGGVTPKGRQAPTGRLLILPLADPAPRWDVWALVETFEPAEAGDGR